MDLLSALKQAIDETRVGAQAYGDLIDEEGLVPATGQMLWGAGKQVGRDLLDAARVVRDAPISPTIGPLGAPRELLRAAEAIPGELEKAANFFAQAYKQAGPAYDYLFKGNKKRKRPTDVSEAVKQVQNVIPKESRQRDLNVAELLRQADSLGETPMFRLGPGDEVSTRMGVSRPQIRGEGGKTRDMTDALTAIRLQQLQEDPRAFAHTLRTEGASPEMNAALMNNVAKLLTSMSTPEEKAAGIRMLEQISGNDLSSIFMNSPAQSEPRQAEPSEGDGMLLPTLGSIVGMIGGPKALAKLGFTLGSWPGALVGGAVGAGAGTLANHLMQDE